MLGDGMRELGAAARPISEDTSGVSWVKIEGRREPQRARAFHTTDADLCAGLGRHAAGKEVRLITFVLVSRSRMT